MTKALTNRIQLEDFRLIAKDGSIAKIFTGRDRGRDVRDASKIDEIETKFETVEFIIPDNIYSINPSFFEELFFNVVTKLGKDKFLEKFHFQCLGEYDYKKPLYEAITRILKTKSALG